MGDAIQEYMRGFLPLLSSPLFLLQFPCLKKEREVPGKGFNSLRKNGAIRCSGYFPRSRLFWRDSAPLKNHRFFSRFAPRSRCPEKIYARSWHLKGVFPHPVKAIRSHLDPRISGGSPNRRPEGRGWIYPGPPGFQFHCPSPPLIP